MQCVMDTLQNFCSLTGQEVSEEISNILFSSNVTRSLRHKLLKISKLEETDQFDKYLRVPLSGKTLRRVYFQYIIDQVSVRLMNWKANSLSLADQTTLAKSVLEVILIYPMMMNFLPKSCLEEIQRMKQNFI